MSAPALASGSRLGPYVLVAPIGAGGMGEVYRARDERLGRDVAIKVLSQGFSGDTTRLRRFEQEARSVAAINHPNILAVFDFDARGEPPYLVTEVLEGSSLRQRIRQPRPWRTSLDWALQIARGLAAAHDKGIVHRDVKPENLFVTTDGRVKILDFGIAKPSPTADRSLALANTMDPADHPQVDPAVAVLPVVETTAGMVVGTPGYMSPEQVRGESPDHRSDLFSFGSVLYELLAGEPCFPGETAIEKAASVLKNDPPPLPPSLLAPPALERVMRRCLSKEPGERFQSTRDLVFDLQEILDNVHTAPSGSPSPAQPPRPRPSLRRFAPAALSLLAVAALASLATWKVAARATDGGLPSYRRLTFRRGSMHAARFAPDGRQIVYASAVDGDRVRVFVTTPDNPEGRALTQPGVGLFDVSSRGEMALRILPPPGSTVRGSTLARAHLDGGAPRTVIDGVRFADFSPDGEELAAIRYNDENEQLEFPLGTPLYRCRRGEDIASPRVSPRGDAVAFVHYPFNGDDRGSIELVGRDGKVRVLSQGWLSIQGLAFSARGDELWFAAARGTETRGLHAVTLDGRERRLGEGPAAMVLQDVSSDGRVLLHRDGNRRAMFITNESGTEVRNISWLDMPWIFELSRDGRRVLFLEGGEAVRNELITYYRDLDGSPAVQIGLGVAWGLSPDAQRVTMSRPPYAELHIVPLGPGVARSLPRGPLTFYELAFFIDEKRIAICGSEEGRPRRVWLQELGGGEPRPLTGDGYRLSSVSAASPDGTTLLAVGPEGHHARVHTDGRPPEPLPGVGDADQVVQWIDDQHLLVRQGTTMPAHLVEVDLVSGRATPWRDLALPDSTGEARIAKVVATRDRRVLAYQLIQFLGDLYLATGLR